MNATATAVFCMVVVLAGLISEQTVEARRRSLTAQHRFPVSNPISHIIVKENVATSMEVTQAPSTSSQSRYQQVASLLLPGNGDNDETLLPIMTCTQWIAAKKQQLGLTTKQLADKLVNGASRQLSLEFYMFCMPKKKAT